MSQNKYFGDTGLDSLEVGGNSPIFSFLTSAMASGKVIADDGKAYDSVDTAVDNANSIVMLGPGTFNENVTVNTAGITIIGSGEGTKITNDNGTMIDIQADNVTVRNMSIETTGSNNVALRFGNSGFTAQNLSFPQASNSAIKSQAGATDFIISNCTFGTITNGIVIQINSNRGIISSCFISADTDNQNGISIDPGQDIIVTNCIIRFTDGTNFQRPIDTFGADNIYIGNILSTQNGSVFRMGGSDEIAANNRMYSADGNYFGAGNVSTDDDNKKTSFN